MNFIVVVSDTLRRDFLGCYGNRRISTPSIDRFAADSLVFDHGYSGSFPTVPHRRDVMTGRFTFTYTGWAPMTPQEPVVAELLSRAGYVTMMVADCPHILEDGYHFDKGFDGWEWIRGQESDRWKTSPEETRSPCPEEKIRNHEWINRRHRRNVAQWRFEEERFVARTMAEACRWLESNYKRPFFLYVDTFDPHEPWDAPSWYVDMYDPGYEGHVVDYPQYSRTDFLTPEELRHARALYSAEVTLVDRWVGRLFQKVEDLGLFRNSMLLFTADHGFLLGEHGIIGKALLEYGASGNRYTQIPLYSEISRVPWIVRVPGGGSGRRNALVQAPDIMATLLDYAGVEPPQPMDGRSFRPVLEGGRDAHRDIAVSSPAILRGGLGDVQPTVTDGRWAYYPVGKPLETSGEDAVDRGVDGLEKRWYGREYVPLLFDRETDPAEEHDLLAARADVAAGFHARFLDLLREWKTREDLREAWRER